MISQLSRVSHICHNYSHVIICYIKKKNIKSSRITLYNIFTIYWPYK